MNDALKMQISAYVDGELPENESELLVRRLCQDATLRRQAAEYLAIGRMIRRDPQVRGMDDLRDRIAAAIGDEAQLRPAPETVATTRFAKPLAGFAIAASVAVLALFGLRQVEVPQPEGPLLTRPQAGESTENRLLDRYRRYHADSSDAASVDQLARFVTWGLNEEGLVEVDPVAHTLEENAPAAEDDADNEEDSDESRQAE